MTSIISCLLICASKIDRPCSLACSRSFSEYLFISMVKTEFINNSSTVGFDCMQEASYPGSEVPKSVQAKTAIRDERAPAPPGPQSVFLLRL